MHPVFDNLCFEVSFSITYYRIFYCGVFVFEILSQLQESVTLIQLFEAFNKQQNDIYRKSSGFAMATSSEVKHVNL